MQRLKGKRALITGAGSGIGLATARLFVKEGAEVIMVDRKPLPWLQALEREIGSRCTAIHADVTKMADLDEVMELAKRRWGQLDILFPNAGIITTQSLGTITEAVFDRQFATNFKAVVFGVQKALPILADGASIILMSSCMSEMGAPGYTAYGATKAAVRSLARNWTVELANRGIRVNALLPGGVDTPLLEDAGVAPGSNPEVFDALIPRIPMARISSAEEIARCALFLATDDSSYMTGSALAVDGGIGQI
ncbi:SDR family NAD(P)-dependent oxidoreductase [Stakelama flava]|uniref:SDR family NAD(P)-dependent oxidoreductase n=1 Tax=Stakelama flava TaxID=2860338 RepID=UPI001FE2E8AB|nr:SDR family oxidoreductase [Stakelama flava]